VEIAREHSAISYQRSAKELTAKDAKDAKENKVAGIWLRMEAPHLGEDRVISLQLNTKYQIPVPFASFASFAVRSLAGLVSK
jgi:hypothetical protein